MVLINIIQTCGCLCLNGTIAQTAVYPEVQQKEETETFVQSKLKHTTNKNIRCQCFIAIALQFGALWHF